MNTAITSTQANRPDSWEICSECYPVEDPALQETILSLANGYLGLRGDLAETANKNPACHAGTYINGFYESSPITYGESAYGYAHNNQTMLNLPNAKQLRLNLDGEAFDMDCGNLEDYRCTLSLKEGLLRRELTWISPQGKKAHILMERLVSFEHRHIAAIRYAVTPLNFSGTLQFETGIDGDVRNKVSAGDPRVGASAQKDALQIFRLAVSPDLSYMACRTKRSGLSMCCGTAAVLESASPHTAVCGKSEKAVRSTYQIAAKEKTETTLYQYLCYLDSREYAPDQMQTACREELEQIAREGFSKLKVGQAAFLSRFWSAADIQIEGDGTLQQSIRYSMFQLLQSAGRDGKTNISSKGLSGEGYEGHYFWDTEMYIFPFFLHTYPQVARKLLEYRYSTLQQARARAAELHHKGALFPWRTINGEECSAYYPAGTAQYHIDADIAHAVWLYTEVSGDETFLRDCGAEILFETARFWADLGYFNPHKNGQFCINCVTGPDEYNVLVNNNCYTNLMAANNFRHALAAADLLREKYPRKYRELVQKLHLSDEEYSFWQKACQNMYIPYDEALQIHLQDDTFLDREPWDFLHTPRENYPLLLHYHPLDIYRHSVCKQADMILALFLLPDQFTEAQAKRDYDFYEKITTHDSSLSPSVFCIMACALGYHADALRYFTSTARMDLDNCNGNTADGIHTASMAGTWMGIVCGFGGMRMRGGELHFSPYLPDGWQAFSFRVTYRRRLLRVRVERERTSYTLLEGDPLSFWHQEKRLSVDQTHPVTDVPSAGAAKPEPTATE